MGTPETLSTEALLDETAWLRRLARQLVRDDGRAEDMVQKTLVAAWTRRRGGRVPGRRWLGAVLRNQVRALARAGVRRADREAAAGARGSAPPPASPASDEVAARIELHRRLVEAVAELDEPGRTAIALRFLEGLPPREVARRTGVPVQTVHSRIERALARLRARLDDRYGGRREAWALAAGELAGPFTTFGAAKLGAVAMGAAWKWGVVAAGAVVVGVAVNRVSQEAESSPAAVAAEAAAPVVREEVAAVETPDTGATPARRAPAAAPASEPAAPVAQPTPATFEGRVVDVVGAPVADATVVLVPFGSEEEDAGAGEDRTAVTDEWGVFHMPLQDRGGHLAARGRGLATLVAPGVTDMPPPEPPVVVVGPSCSWSGAARDVAGTPIEGVRLAVHLPAEVAPRLRPGLFGRTLPSATTESAADGTFAFRDLGFVEGITLRATHPLYRTTSVPLPATSATDLDVVLEHRLEPGSLAGTVVDASGVPVAGAFVSTGSLSTETDSTGAFVLPPDAADGSEVRAVAPGFLPARRPLADLGAGERGALLLVLGEPALSITGRVVDASGDPVPEAVVWSWDTERFGDMLHPIGELDFMLGVDTEAVLAGRGVDVGCHASADSQGRFELRGLRRAAYGLTAMNRQTLAHGGPGATGAVLAGTRDVVIVVGDEGVVPVAGRVTGLDGAPLGGVEVSAQRAVDSPSGPRFPPDSHKLVSVETDADGRFRFDALAVPGTTLSAAHDGADAEAVLDEVADPTSLVLRVPRRCHLRVLLESDPGLAHRLALLDENGEALSISILAGSVTLGAQGLPIVGGTSGLITTSDAARTLVLRHDEEGEVLRVPLDLVPGEVNEFRL